MDIKELIDKHFSSSHLSAKDFENNSRFLDGIDIKRYCEYVFINTSTLGASELFLGVFKKWSDFNYSDFKEIISLLKHSKTGLLHFTIFLGKYLKIDIRDELIDIPSNTREYVLSYVKDRSISFYFDKKRDHLLLEKFNLDYESSFSEIRERLRTQGAKEAKSHKPVSLDIPPLNGDSISD